MTGTRVTIAGERVCDAELTFRIMPFPSIDFREQMMRTAVGISVGARRNA
jgi:hypothetical protein